MKALKSERARELLGNPETARLLRDAALRAGYGPQNGVLLRVPKKDGRTETLNVYYVPGPEPR